MPDEMTLQTAWERVRKQLLNDFDLYGDGPSVAPDVCEAIAFIDELWKGGPACQSPK